MATRRVQFTTDYDTYPKGDIVDLDAGQAASLINSGVARSAPTPTPPVATVEIPTPDPQRGRKPKEA